MDSGAKSCRMRFDFERRQNRIFCLVGSKRVTAASFHLLIEIEFLLKSCYINPPFSTNPCLSFCFPSLIRVGTSNVEKQERTAARP